MTQEERESGSLAMTGLRGAAIGLISGAKGGAVAGALGGALLMVSQTAASGEWSIVLFSLVLSLTTGMMAGAMAGVIYGAVAGGLSGRLLAGVPAAAIARIWLPLAAGLVAVLGWLLVPGEPARGALVGGVLGLLAGRIAGRDFVRVAAEQGPGDGS